MSEQRTILSDTVDRLFRDAAASPTLYVDGWNASLWQQVERLALPLLLVPEAARGVGGTWDDAFVVLHRLGYHAIALPIAEAMLAARLAAMAGLDPTSGVVSLAARVTGSVVRDVHGCERFTGELSGIPWGRHASSVVGVMRDGEARVIVLRRCDATSAREHCNLAGEPRDALHYAGAEVVTAPCDAPEAAQDHQFGALLRVGQSAGALDALLARSVLYAQERTQFGKPIGGFQAVQHQIAMLAAEAAAAGAAARAAFHAAALGEAGFEIAAGKLRVNRAIDVATSIAHQVHGAIGFTREFDLGRWSQRLWSWRSEFGSDRYWAGILGGAVAARGAGSFWPDLTRRGDRAAHIS
jgi:acyl-CoA dehydrogenase